MTYKIYLDEDKGWTKKSSGSSNLFIKGYLNNRSILSVLNFFLKSKFNKKKCFDFIRKLDGHFAIIFFDKKNILICCDRISSIPLIIKKGTNKIYVADNYKNLKNIVASKNKFFIDVEQSINLASSGYTFGRKTIFKDVIKTFPGFFYLYHRNKLEEFQYYDWRPYIKKPSKKTKSKNFLKKLNIKIIKKLILSSKGRFIAVPLSAGYDSRLILSGLVEQGYKNIISFSYGRARNREALVAEKIAKKLNIPWFFIEYIPSQMKNIFLSKEYKLFKDYADLTDSIYFLQDFFAIKSLKNNNIIPSDSIIVNGQSGDFISGNHIFYKSLEDTYDDLVTFFFKKHFKISRSIMITINEKIKENIKKRISNFNININNINNIREALQKIEYEDRQAKFLMGGQRTYEFFGFDWRLPLWDKEYVEFFENLNIEFKINQSLYKEVMLEQNWGDVWKDIPLNPKNTFSIRLELIRFIFKCFFSIYGKKRWHKFELKFLDYFMTPLCGYAAWNYFDIIFNNNGYTSPLGWHIKEYLNEKSVNWNGKHFYN